MRCRERHRGDLGLQVGERLVLRSLDLDACPLRGSVDVRSSTRHEIGLDDIGPGAGLGDDCFGIDRSVAEVRLQGGEFALGIGLTVFAKCDLVGDALRALRRRLLDDGNTLPDEQREQDEKGRGSPVELVLVTVEAVVRLDGRFGGGLGGGLAARARLGLGEQEVDGRCAHRRPLTCSARGRRCSSHATDRWDVA